MGEVVSELGFSPDPEKISAIHNIPTPSCNRTHHATEREVVGKKHEGGRWKER